MAQLLFGNLKRFLSYTKKKMAFLKIGIPYLKVKIFEKKLLVTQKIILFFVIFSMFYESLEGRNCVVCAIKLTLVLWRFNILLNL